MKDSEFLTEVERIFSIIYETIEDHDMEGNIDMHDGILTLDTNKGTFVLNKQSSTKEIWLSSPISGPYHFVLQDNYWKSRSGVELFEILTNELNIKIARQPQND